jgi:16S rRNA (guanine527-N7)-methyltransferase
VEIEDIAVLLKPFAELTEQQLASTSAYLSLLLKWNSRINLTAVRSADEIVRRHFGESLFAAQTLVARDYAGTVIDLGSGAGFPGIPMAMYARNAQVTLIESNSKKAVFLNEVVRTLDLHNVRVFNRRAEDYSERAELVVMRAVEKFESSVALAAGLVSQEGRLAIMIGKAQIDRAKDMLSSWRWLEPIDIPESQSRVLFVGTP